MARRLVSDASDVMRASAGVASWDGVEGHEPLLERAVAAIGTVQDPGEAVAVLD